MLTTVFRTRDFERALYISFVPASRVHHPKNHEGQSFIRFEVYSLHACVPSFIGSTKFRVYGVLEYPETLYS